MESNFNEKVLQHKHLIIKADVMNPPTNPDYISKIWMPELIKSIGMKVLMGPYATYCDMKGNRGLTAVAIIETSHIVIHSWDECEPGMIQFDLYTCGALEPETVVPFLDEFNPIKIESKYLDREKGLEEIM